MVSSKSRIREAASIPFLLPYAVIKGLYDGYNMDASDLDGSSDHRVSAYQ